MLDTNFWKKYFKDYDSLNYLPSYKDLVKEIVDELDIQHGDFVLEAGCGTCNVAREIVKKGGSVTGIDNCKEALSVCKEKKFPINLQVADLNEKLPFDDSVFDKIVLNNVLYTISLERHDGLVRELYRILKHGGVIAFTNPKKNWKPFTIYKKGVKKLFQRESFISALKTVILLIIPTIKILYNNVIISKQAKYYFFEKGEQKKLLNKIGFAEISDERYVYEGQCFIISAKK